MEPQNESKLHFFDNVKIFKPILKHLLKYLGCSLAAMAACSGYLEGGDALKGGSLVLFFYFRDEKFILTLRASLPFQRPF